MKHVRYLIHLKLAVGRFKCTSAYIHAYNYDILFCCFSARIGLQHWIDYMQFFNIIGLLQF